MNVGFDDDQIFLLSIDEYEIYKNKIPEINFRYWLRDASQLYEGFVYRVGFDSDTYKCDTCPSNKWSFVRPAIKYNSNEPKIEIGGFQFIKIDNGLYIAKSIIGNHRFDVDSDVYETSEIREWLLNWYYERVGGNDFNTSNLKQYKGQKFWE